MKINLWDAWDCINAIAFDGELDRPPLMVYRKLSNKNKNGGIEELAGGYDPDRGIYIGLRPHTTVLQVLDTLYHEMCHQWIHEMTVENPFEHGVLFCGVYARGLEKLSRAITRRRKYRQLHMQCNNPANS